MRFLCSFILLLFHFSSLGQQIRLTISDSTTKETLPYTNVYLKNTGLGSSSNIDGVVVFDKNTLLNIDTFIVSYIGYETKKIPYSSKQTEFKLSVELSPLTNTLGEMVLTYEKPLKPEKIVKNAIKNTSKNYFTQNVLLKALYREYIEENDKCIQLNEAITKTHYTAYPQKKLDPTIWEDWFENDEYAFHLDGNRFFDHLLVDYNTKEDQQEILASRSSNNWSKHNLNSTIVGDPLNLLALDKIKYQFDFLNPSNLNKYEFKLKGTEEVDDMMYYVVSFYPKHTSKRFILDRSTKNKNAMYIGTMHIHKESFALKQIEYRLAINKDYGFFNLRMPLDYQGKITYKKHKDHYLINSITLQETQKFGKKENGEAILHRANREFHVIDVETEHVKQIPDSNRYHSTLYSSIRYFKEAYNPEYWNTNPLPSHLDIPINIKSDLEEDQTLNDQFTNNKREVKHLLSPPKALCKNHVFNYHNTTVKDSLHWMANPSNQTTLKSYLEEENTYAKNELVEDKSYQHKLFNQLNTFYPPVNDSLQHHSIGSYFYNENSDEETFLYVKTDSNSQQPIFNVSDFLNNHPSAYIKGYKSNQSKNLLLIQYEKVGILGDFISIYPYNTKTPIDTIQNVYTAEWHSDSTILYSKTNALGRAETLELRTLSNHSDSCIYKENEKTFDVEIIKENNLLFCTVQSKTENEIYLISTKDDKVNLKCLKQRQPFINHTVKVNQGIYILVNSEKKGSYIEFIDPKTSLVPIQITKPLKSNHIIDFLPIQSGIVAYIYESSIPKLKWVNQGQSKWKTLDLNLPMGEYTLVSELKNSNGFRFQFSSPLQPYSLYQYKLNTKQLILENQIQTYYHHLHFRKAISINRFWTKSKDGTKIPITYIKRSNLDYNEVKGLILKTYGAYGSILEPTFNAQGYLLLRQGFAIAFAHVRGGGILGNQWYKQGRVLQKENSIDDYLACAQYFLDKHQITNNKLFGYGNSAGGLVVAQAVNKHPDLFNSIILDHPYLDVVNTMMDETLPLTVDEYKEWGNPKDKVIYDYIKSYSPYQNIKPNHYPNIYVTASFQDYQTPVWQIAKYVAKLRKNNLSNSKVVLLTDMNSGHQGNTQGKMWIKSYANMYSFIHLQLTKEKQTN